MWATIRSGTRSASSETQTTNVRGGRAGSIVMSGRARADTPSKRSAAWLPSAVPSTSRPLTVISARQIRRPPSTQNTRLLPSSAGQIRIAAIALWASWTVSPRKS